MKKVFKRLIKIMLVVLIVILITPFLIYAVMFLSTNQVLDDVKREMRTAGYYENGNRSDIVDEHPIKRFNYTYLKEFGLAKKFKMKVWRRFVWHNFYDGYIWAAWYKEVYNENGECIDGGGTWQSPIASKWKIHRDSIFDKWEIVEIYERP